MALVASMALAAPPIEPIVPQADRADRPLRWRKFSMVRVAMVLDLRA